MCFFYLLTNWKKHVVQTPQRERKTDHKNTIRVDLTVQIYSILRSFPKIIEKVLYILSKYTAIM